MINVSRDWKVALGCYKVPNRNRLVPVNDIQIEYEQIDATAQNTATVAVNTNESWSDHNEVMNLSIDFSTQNRIATLEPNLWVLDGSNSLTPTDTHCGWVSQSISGADGTFTTNPKITLTWSTLQTAKIPGLTIWWSTLCNEFPNQFKITAYNNNAVVAQVEIKNNYLDEDFYKCIMQNYNKVEVEIIKWSLPNRRVRLEKLQMGFTVKLSKSDILSIDHGMSSDLLSFTLPNHYFTFELNNTSEEWNPDNPTGRFAFLLERQRVNVKYAYKIGNTYEWVNVGTYFMSEWTTPQNGITASFTARCLIDFMTRTFNPSSITGYSFGDSITLKALAEAAFSQANLPLDVDGSTKWSITNELANTSVVIPYKTEQGETVWDFNYSCAQVIQLVANAGCAVITANTDGDICIQMPEDEITDYYIDRFVSFSNGEYTLTKALKDININNGELIYTPSNTVETGEEQAISNPLLQSLSQRTNVCAWIANILEKRKSISGEFRADPRLQPLDTITNVNKYATNFVYLNEVKWSYNGAFNGTYSGTVMKSIALADQMGEYFTGDTYTGEYGGN